MRSAGSDAPSAGINGSRSSSVDAAAERLEIEFRRLVEESYRTIKVIKDIRGSSR